LAAGKLACGRIPREKTHGRSKEEAVEYQTKQASRQPRSDGGAHGRRVSELLGAEAGAPGLPGLWPLQWTGSHRYLARVVASQGQAPQPATQQWRSGSSLASGAANSDRRPSSGRQGRLK